jgi:hypothetical protein
MNSAFLRVHDQEFVDLMGGVERQLVPRLVTRRDDLDNEGCSRMPGASQTLAMQPAVGHPKVVLGVAQVELAHRREQTGVAHGFVEQHRKLLGDIRVFARWRGNHMQLTLPYLIQAIESRATPTREQLLQTCR